MDENKTPLYAGIIGFCLTFVIYQVAFNWQGGTFVGWLLAFAIPAIVGAVAFVAAQKLT